MVFVITFCFRYHVVFLLHFTFCHMLSEVQDSQGNKMINQYVRERKIGTGSYGKVVSNFRWQPESLS